MMLEIGGSLSGEGARAGRAVQAPPSSCESDQRHADRQ